MIARELISDTIPPLLLTDTIQKVLERMAEFRVSSLPLVDGDAFVGLISDDDLYEFPDYSKSLNQIDVVLRPLYTSVGQHLYEVLRLFNENRLSVLPVLDEENRYVGLISQSSVVESLASVTAMKEPGAIIVLEMTSSNNSLSHIAQIVESSNAHILSSYITSFPDSTRTEVTIKVNRIDIAAMLSTFLRYNYNVIEVYNEAREGTASSDRYDSLMNYLSF